MPEALQNWQAKPLHKGRKDRERAFLIGAMEILIGDVSEPSDRKSHLLQAPDPAKYLPALPLLVFTANQIELEVDAIPPERLARIQKPRMVFCILEAGHIEDSCSF